MVRGRSRHHDKGVRWVCADIAERIVSDYGGNFLGGKNAHLAGKTEFGSETSFDAGKQVAARFLRGRKENVAAVEQGPHILESEAFKQNPKVGHRNARCWTGKVDAAKQGNVGGPLNGASWNRAHARSQACEEWF